MKKAFLAITTLAILAGCKKDASPTQESPSLVVSSDVLLPLPCHSTNFVTNYLIKPGEQPPFRFTKTLYTDTRVYSINMLSRAVPNYPTFKKQMWETNGKFAYATNKGTFTGTKELWEYYKTPAGAAARRSLQKINLSLTFNFNQKGYVQSVVNNNGSYDKYSNVYHPVTALSIQYGSDVPDLKLPPDALAYVYVTTGLDQGAEGPLRAYVPKNDQYGNPLYFFTAQSSVSGLMYTYDYSLPRNAKNYSFIPSQNLISYEYNLCEVMQWLPQPTHQRKTVTGQFNLEDPGHTAVAQSQTYVNYKFDAKGNETSVSYGDNVPQMTTWYCH